MKVFVISQKTKLNSEDGYCPLCAGYRYKNSEQNDDSLFSHETLYSTCCLINNLYHITNKKEWRKCEFKKKKSELYRNEIKSYIVRAGMTMSEVVDYLADEYGWSSSVPNLSGKLKRGSLRYGEAVELADALGYDIVWVKRG
jgi:hypothetical protein